MPLSLLSLVKLIKSQNYNEQNRLPHLQEITVICQEVTFYLL